MESLEPNTTQSWLSLITKLETSRTKIQIVKDKQAELATYTKKHNTDTKKILIYYMGVYKI